MQVRTAPFEYSIVIPTFNRYGEMILTLPQIIDLVDDNGEIIVVDQSNDGQPLAHQQTLQTLCEGANVRYYLAKEASLSLAINTGASLAKADIVIILDDDIDIIDKSVIKRHLKHYDDKNTIAVAGCYYAGNMQSPWIPSKKGNIATSLASAHMSGRKSTFANIGAATWLVKPFSTIDWEMVEVFNRFGNVIADTDSFVFHRAPIDGGCGNQGSRGVEWYRATYHNHTLWVLSRPWPDNILKLPKHFYTLVKYCLPKRAVLQTKRFWVEAVWGGVKDGIKTFKNKQKQRSFDVIGDHNLALMIETTRDNRTNKTKALS
jgi:glycosyltransferase involved in cell wall biosynthesis